MAVDRFRASPDGHYLVDPAGNKILLIGCCVWALMQRTTLSQARDLIDDRKANGFNCLAWWTHPVWAQTNKFGDGCWQSRIDNTNTPVVDGAFWSYVDQVTEYMQSKDMWLCIHAGKLFETSLGDNCSSDFGTHSQHLKKTYECGYAMGARMRHHTNVFYSTGADLHPSHDGKIGSANSANGGAKFKELCKYLAKGLADGHNQASSNHNSISQNFATTPVITHHPGNPGGTGGVTSGDFFHHDSPDWCTIHMHQSGRSNEFGPNRYLPQNYVTTQKDWNRSNPVPTGDGENSYNGARSTDESNEFRTKYHSRNEIYWQMFSGAAYTIGYSHLSLWQLYDTQYSSRGGANVKWETVIAQGDADFMPHLRNLLESRPLMEAVPDQTVFTSSQSDQEERLQALREPNGHFAMVYITNGRTITIDLTHISGTTAVAWWFDPRNGENIKIGEYPTTGTRSFDPPGSPSSFSTDNGNDWIIVIDNKAKNYPAPGTDLVEQETFPVAGHRGGRGERPENTDAAMGYCIANEYNLELDVRLSSDNQIMVIHDDTVNRTTTSSGSVDNFTASQLEGMDAGSHFSSAYSGEGVPKLDDILANFIATAPPGLTMSIDTKDEVSTMWNALRALFIDHDCWNRCWVEVDSNSNANALKAVDSRFRLAIWTPGSSDTLNAINSGLYERIHIPTSRIQLIDEILAAGIFCSVFLNTLEEWCEVVNSAVALPSGVHTDFPSLIDPTVRYYGLGS